MSRVKLPGVRQVLGLRVSLHRDLGVAGPWVPGASGSSMGRSDAESRASVPACAGWGRVAAGAGTPGLRGW